MNQNTKIIYDGLLWEDGVKNISETVKDSLGHEDMPPGAGKSVFSVFVEMATNVLMHSAKEVKYSASGDNARQPLQTDRTRPLGKLCMKYDDNAFVIETHNVVQHNKQNMIKAKIDNLNSLDKTELRALHRQRLREENDNPDSRGAGLGLIEIARRVTAPIQYKFEPVDKDNDFLTIRISIGHSDKEAKSNAV